MTFVDVVVVGLAALSALRGWRIGFLGQIFEFGGGFLGLVAGMAAGPWIADAFTDKPGLQGALISLVVVFVLMSAGQTAGHIAGHRGKLLAHRARLGGVNSGMGAGFGIVVTLVSFWLVGSLLVHVPVKPLASAFRRSALLRVTSDALPQPPDVLAYFRQYLDTSGFPQVFAGLPPAFGPPVKLPSNAQARRAVLAAQDSTFQIRTPACGGLQLGSGWMAAPGTVVTNAHVVAGGTDVTVRSGDGEHDATVVLFDPDIDIAVLRVPGLDADVLPLEEELVERGAPGATLGFPGEAGGRMVTHRAAVQNVYQDARGRDIYGRRQVTRSVYALRSPVRQGDSGGPFVLPDGRVAGVVFAASTTDEDLGYALTGEEVADEIARGSRRDSGVGTGSCTH